MGTLCPPERPLAAQLGRAVRGTFFGTMGFLGMCAVISFEILSLKPWNPEQKYQFALKVPLLGSRAQVQALGASKLKL